MVRVLPEHEVHFVAQGEMKIVSLAGLFLSLRPFKAVAIGWQVGTSSFYFP
jgi:hypothetical protein